MEDLIEKGEEVDEEGQVGGGQQTKQVLGDADLGRILRLAPVVHRSRSIMVAASGRDDAPLPDGFPHTSSNLYGT